MKEYDIHFKLTINDFLGSFEAETEENAKQQARLMIMDNLDFYLNRAVVHFMNGVSVDEFELNITDVLEV